jgi:TonB family protein
MSRCKMVVMFLLCCTAFGFAQNAGDSQSETQASASQTVSLSAADMATLVDQKVIPDYPKEALTKGIQGDVIFKIHVNESGKITSSEPLQGDPLLVAAAADALRDTRFHPYLLNGNPVPVVGKLGFHFTLSRQGDTTEGQVECMSEIP